MEKAQITLTKPEGDIRRPLVRYHGGKFILADWIISHFPKHRIYCEPFGGGASVLLKKPRSYAEIYNDLDSNIVSVFRAARDYPSELIRWIGRTPYSRQIFNETYEKGSNPVDVAGRFIARSFMGFGSAAITSNKGRTGFRANSNRSGTTPAHDWKNYVRHLSAITKRMRGVVIENVSAVDLIRSADSESTLFYIDPPYLPETRWTVTPNAYKYEMTFEQHEQLLQLIQSLKGFVIISGYESELYMARLSGWKHITKDSLKSGRKGGVVVQESLWINPAAQAALDKERNTLFSEAIP